MSAISGSLGREIFSLQVLRGLAALGVVIYHFELDLHRHVALTGAVPNLLGGSAGVDLFFVLSGFVMVYASEKLFGTFDGPGTFFVRRLIRIVPLYWCVTTIYLGIGVLVPQVSHKTYSFAMIGASYLFIPWSSPEGSGEPIVGQGWTLNYEMVFYLLFSIAVFLQRRVAVLVLSLTLIFAVVLGHNIGSLPMPLSFWSKPIILEFAFGMWLGLGYSEGLRLPRWGAIALICVGVALMCIVFYNVDTKISHREFKCGLPAAMIVAGAVFAGPSARLARWQWLGAVGEASYALYLLHAIPIRAMREIAVRSGVEIAAMPYRFLAIDVALAVSLALVVYYYVELPLTRALRASFECRRAKALRPLSP
jgi:peptidoglycan/LPS O-acetylase OafA/YrhL